jgi:hypothetical protein
MQYGRSYDHTPAPWTPASPLTLASSLSTSVLCPFVGFCLYNLGLISGLGISRVFDLFGLNGFGVLGLEFKNCDATVSATLLAIPDRAY